MPRQEDAEVKWCLLGVFVRRLLCCDVEGRVAVLPDSWPDSWKSGIDGTRSPHTSGCQRWRCGYKQDIFTFVTWDLRDYIFCDMLWYCGCVFFKVAVYVNVWVVDLAKFRWFLVTLTRGTCAVGPTWFKFQELDAEQG